MKTNKVLTVAIELVVMGWVVFIVVVAAHAQPPPETQPEPLRTKGSFVITGTTPPDSDVAGVHMFIRYVSDPPVPWTLIGSIDAGPNEHVEIAVAGMAEGLYELGAVIEDDVENRSEMGLGTMHVEIDRTPPGTMTPGVKASTDVNGDGQTNAADIQTIINAVLGL